MDTTLGCTNETKRFTEETYDCPKKTIRFKNVTEGWRGGTSAACASVTYIVSDDHPGMAAARQAVFGAVPWQRCQFHLQQNAQGLRPAPRDGYDAFTLVFYRDAK